MNVKERFYETMSALNLTDYRVYTDIEEITKGMMVKLRKGLTNEVSTKILVPFLNAYPQVNANYIITGRGSIFISTEELPESNRITNKTTYEKLLEEYTRQTEELLSQRDKEIRALQLENARLKAEAATKEAV
ncbi:hypothetical protein K0G70_21995 [Bacteroides fragilis]|nr:hypothetical protein [Bacteroides fragilis]MCE9302870.1 hypothetical protein [Bacteroides fragilis]